MSEPADSSSSMKLALAELESEIPGRLRMRASDRMVYAHDASHFVLVPGAVAIPQTAQDIAHLFKVAARHSVPLTFRSGGTSLSGQAGTTGILADSRRHFRRIDVIDNGDRVRVQPGATLRAVNARLAPHGRKLGPDPASEIACTIGGVVANNSSGMSCGTEWNSYHTLDSLTFILPSGTLIDSSVPDADDQLRLSEPELYAGLIGLRDRIRANSESVRKIQQLFSIKNTMGYGLNSFLDYDRPIDILVHLIVGSEGTLAFIAEATFRTVPVRRIAATGLVLFQSLTQAAEALPMLVRKGFTAIELLDSQSLKVAQQDQYATPWLQQLKVDHDAAFLLELEHDDAESLNDMVSGAERSMAGLGALSFTGLEQDARQRAALWKIRKGLYASVAGARPPGTTALLEDVAVPVERLSDTCANLHELFAKHSYEESVIFGHARDGNIHFLINERFETSTDRYLAFTEDLVDLVLSNEGTLKAEHGTGRAMAPYVRRQYGDELYEVMVQLKKLVDPRNMLNPGVIIDDTGSTHLVGLKTTARVEEEVDRCVECGYCEPSCPSKDLTFTPRQRIVLRREIARAKQAGDKPLVQELNAAMGYEVQDTCAVDGMCQVACPVSIDTGALVRRLRSESASSFEQWMWSAAARQWSAAARSVSALLTLAKALPPVVPRVVSSALSAVSAGRIPRWTEDLPRGGNRRLARLAADADIVFFPSCMSEVFGDDGLAPNDAFVTLCVAAGRNVGIPEGIAGLCCGTPWKSKGFYSGLSAMTPRLRESLPPAALSGAVPIVVDASSCTQGLRESLSDLPNVRVMNVAEFVAHELLESLPIRKTLPAVVLHPTCADIKAGSVEDLRTIAGSMSYEVFVPSTLGCCGFAGDRGLTHPQLTASATENEADEVKQFVSRHQDAKLCSTNKPCEIGISRATGLPYQHLITLLAQQLQH